MQAVGTPEHWMDSPPAVDPAQLRGAPMLAAALCFSAGDLIARHWEPPALLVTSCGLVLLLAVVSLLLAKRVATVPVLAVWVLVGCTCAQIQLPISRQPELTSYADGLSRTVRARVVRVRQLAPDNSSHDKVNDYPWALGPGAWEPISGEPHRSVDLNVEAVEDVTPDVSTMRPVDGGVRVTVMDPGPALGCGDVIEVPLRLRLPDTYRDPGAWSYSDYLLGQGIGALASARTQRLRIVGHARGSWSCRLAAAQSWASNRLRKLSAPASTRWPAWMQLNSDDTAMLSAMLVGDRTQLTTDLRAGFERTGTFHLFVVSGLHIVLVVGGLLWLLRKTRMRDGAAVTIALALGLLFALLSGFGTPVQRALGMTAAYLLARLIGRGTGPLNALGIAAVAILAIDPRTLFEPSFQMTTLVILAAAGLARPVEARSFHPHSRGLRNLDTIALDANIYPRIAQLRVRLRMFGQLCSTLLHPRLRHLPLWLGRGLASAAAAVLFGVAVEICMVLPMATYFHRATLLALPTNLLLVPLIAVLLALTILTFCTSLISLAIARVPAACTAALIHLIRGTVDRIGHVSVADLRVPAPSPELVLAACTAIVLACIALRLRSRVWLVVACMAMVAAPVVALWPTPPRIHPGVLEVTAIDVGQGDSLLVISPKGGTLLVDAGGPVGPTASNSRWDVGEEVVAPYLWSRHIRHLDAVMLTHAHSDHMGGMPAVLRDLHPRELWISIEPRQAPAMRSLLAEAKTLGITVHSFHAGDSFNWSGVHADVLSPELGYSNPGGPKNDDSLVMRLAYDKGSVLLEGDAEWSSEADMVLNHRVAPSTLLKVGHHGSKTSTADAFLAAVAPRVAVISVGTHNTFGHPRWEVLNKLEQAHVPTWRTDREGAETFLISPDGGISALSAASNP
ncbi:MAG TPA: ComEC/Rec2 family competence protein [Bryocella sp.]|nr:ComEC/Rec2 family competence protein [Bryocella sp.]